MMSASIRCGARKVDEAIPAYDDTRWNFRDRGLRFAHAKLKEATAELLSQHPHLEFQDDIESQLDRMINSFPPLSNATISCYTSFATRQRLPILRPYWIVNFECDVC